MSQVLWRDAQGVDGVVELAAGEILIGRAMECAIRTEDAMVSRHHARISWQGSQYVIEDLGSSNGIYFEEQRVARHALRDGDVVRCGSLWLRFVAQAAEPRVPAAPPLEPPPGPPPQAWNPPPPQAWGPPPPQAWGPPPPQAPPPQAPPPQAWSPPPPQAWSPPPQAWGPPPAQPWSQPPPSSPAPPAPVWGAPPAHGHEPPPAHGYESPPPQGYALPPAPGFAAPPPPSPAGAGDDIQQLRRRIEQLTAELRHARGGGEPAASMETLEDEVARVSEERDRLRHRLVEVEALIERAGARAVADQVAELGEALGEILASIRINAFAAEGELDQFAQTLPRASFELIREALHASLADAERARELIRRLRDLADNAEPG